MIEPSWRNRALRQFLSLPESARLVIVAIFGSLTGLAVYEVVYYLNPFEPRASISWLLSFIIGVVRQHALHRWLTFSHRGPYWRSLTRAYLLYASLLVVTTALNYLLVEQLQWNHHLVWLICVATVGGINLFALKRFVYSGPHDRP